MAKDVNIPIVTVLMPVYNSSAFLKETIDSVLNQTYRDFVFLIIDDGSTDDSLKIINSYSDNRIKVVKNEKNLKLVATLNKGLQLCETKYIIRMDSDDICDANRIKEQVAFMEANPSIGVSGTFIQLMKAGKRLKVKLPTQAKDVKAFMLFNSPLAHPSVILRKRVLSDNGITYDTAFIHAEDYQMWHSISKYSDIANIGKNLLFYRVHENQITSNPKNKLDKDNSLRKIRAEQLNLFGLQYNESELNCHQIISDGIKAENDKMLADCYTWLCKICTHNKTNNYFDKDSLNKILHERALRLSINTYGLKKGIKEYRKSQLNKLSPLNLKLKYSLFLEYLVLAKRYLNR